jgi:hypothetical protein
MKRLREKTDFMNDIARLLIIHSLRHRKHAVHQTADNLLCNMDKETGLRIKGHGAERMAHCAKSSLQSASIIPQSNSLSAIR